ncbi:AzlD domain-containing protein [Afifella sp. IM 167]|uniref:AzlD domain-containing protein n=1 Tax=Afifella sp. IM 167 TaxID=2033586 RepID=UPI001CD03CDA|nr:AzlD domain-containing protein [Afifella sp. IM 167]MBZ8132363.1 branched-chain amino acid transport [Afifella sp. IM 167]
MSAEAWPYIFILIAGTLATDIWRWLGVLVGARLVEDSDLLLWVKAVATALVAGVIGNLIFAPTGALAMVPLAIRLGAAGFGYVAFFLARKKILIGVLAAEAALIGASYAFAG